MTEQSQSLNPCEACLPLDLPRSLMVSYSYPVRHWCPTPMLFLKAKVSENPGCCKTLNLPVKKGVLLWWNPWFPKSVSYHPGFLHLFGVQDPFGFL